MLIDRLTIRSIRGIGPELPLDLTARITLIYAPNGTAKTSLCDSVEWLFTGEVKRLHALAKSEGNGLRNVCWPELEPFAECELRLGDDHLRVRRSGVAEPNRIQLANGDRWQTASLDDLLARLTPKNLPASAKVIQRLKSRRDWFRAVRFLEAHALDLLIDSDEEADGVRDLVFCDLLGIGEMGRQKRDLLAIIKRIPSNSSLTRDIAAANAEIKRIDAEIQAETVQASESLRQTFQAHLVVAARHLDISEPHSSESLETQLSTVQSASALATEKLTSKRAALEAVDRGSNRYTALGAELIALQKRQEEITEERAQLNRTVEQLAKAKDGMVSEAKKAELQVEYLTALQVESLHAKLQLALHHLASAGGNPNKLLDIAGEEAALSELRKERSRLQTQLGALANCETAHPSWRDARDRERAITERIANLELPSPEMRAEVETELSEARATHRQVETAYGRIAGPVEQLRALADEFLRVAPAEHRCPLCQHDHASPEALRGAITAGLAALPEAVELIAVQKRDIEQRIVALEQRISKWDEASRTMESATAELSAARQVLSRAASTLAPLEIGIDQLDNVDFETHLCTLRTNIEAAMALHERLVIEQEQRVKSVGELRDFATALAAFSDRIEALLALGNPIPKVANEPPGRWPLVVEHITATVKKAITDAQRKADEVNQKSAESGSSVAATKQKLDALAVAETELSQQIGAAQSERRKFETQWRVLAGDAPWTASALEMQPARIDQVADAIAKANQELVSADAALAKASEAEIHERALAIRKSELSEWRRRVRELEQIAITRAECEKGVKAIDVAKDAFVTAQIRPLCNVITALYVRAQGNAFIDCIEPTSDAGPLRWHPQAGEYQLQDTAQMSLGQRQDLALAIFLARARELGGTFFLDEPLLHLDDLNRVALLDVLRSVVVESHARPLRLVVTTANKSLVRLCAEKFALIPKTDNQPALRIYQLQGTPASGVKRIEESF